MLPLPFILQKPELKHVSNKHLTAALAVAMQGIVPRNSPAQATSAPTDKYRPTTPDVQDTACKGDVPLGHEPTKAIETALIVRKHHITHQKTFPPILSWAPACSLLTTHYS